MPKRGKPTPKAMARKIVAENSYHDRELAESVNVLSRRAILEKLRIFYDGIQISAVSFELAEITMDSRGRGSFQT